MSNHSEEIQNLLQQALAIAWVMDNFKSATSTIEVECTNGQKITMSETMYELSSDTLQTSSSNSHIPPTGKSLSDSLGDTKKTIGFKEYTMNFMQSARALTAELANEFNSDEIIFNAQMRRGDDWVTLEIYRNSEDPDRLHAVMDFDINGAAFHLQPKTIH